MAVTADRRELAEPPVDEGKTEFEQFVAARGAALVRFAILLTGDRHRAEDLVQDALARAYLRWGRIQHTDLPDLYVRRMLVNASRSWWRRAANREVPMAEPAERSGAGDPGTQVSERDAVWRQLARLPHRQRAVLVLRYYEDLHDAAIAQILGCTENTVRTHAMRGLRLLRSYLGAGRSRPETRSQT